MFSRIRNLSLEPATTVTAIILRENRSTRAVFDGYGHVPVRVCWASNIGYVLPKRVQRGHFRAD